MKINVLFFGNLAEITQVQTMQVDQVDNLQALQNTLNTKYPGLAEQPYKLAVNETLINAANQSLNDGDEVAFLPPYAGG